MRLTIRFILMLGLFKSSIIFSQCPATICNGAVYDCYITPPNPGCPFGSATWGIYIPWPPHGRIYTSQNVFVQNTSWNGGNPMVWQSSGLLAPGDYVVYFFNNENCCTPSNACTTIPFTIPGPNLEGFISVSIDSGETEYPANRCSSGSVTASFSMNGQNCLPQPTATLVHNGGTIPGVFQAPDQFFFDNVPNSNPITINVTAGPATGTTSTIFLGPCTGGTGGASESTPASAGCADGIITGSLPTAGACGPSGLLIKSLPDMTPVSNYTINAEGTGFTATVPPGEYEITGSTDNGTTYPCYVSPYTITVGEEEGELPFTANVQVVDAQGLCENGKLLISGNSTHPCYAGGFNYEVKNSTTDEVVSSGMGVVGEHLVQGLSGMTNYTVIVSGHFQSGAYSEPQTLGPYSIGVGDPAPELCNGLDDDCDGDIDEDSTDPNTYYVDADGDGFGDPNQTVQACSAPPGTSAVAGDCDDDDNQTGVFDFTQPCSATLDVVVNSIDNVGVWCEGAHITVSLNSSACYSSWTLVSGNMQLMGYDTSWSASAGESISLVVPLLHNDNLSLDFIGIIDGSENTCGASSILSGIGSPLACQYTIDQLTITPQTENEPNGGIVLDYSYPSCYTDETYVEIGLKNPQTGQYVYSGVNDMSDQVDDHTIFYLSGLAAGTYVVDFYYSWGECLAENATTVTIPYAVAPIVADFNGDGTVNQADLDLLHSHYGCIVAQNSDCAMFDLDGDGVIGYGDGLLFIGEFAGN